MENIILFRESADTLEEYDIAKQSKFRVFNRILALPKDQLVVARYSALPFYKELEAELKIINSRLINSFSQHRYVADIKNWYEDFREFTPKTYFNWNIKNLPDESYIVKGETNSRKFQWNRQMFCKTKADIAPTLNRLLDDSLIRSQEVCLREFVKLKTYAIGLNGLPITNEWRVFCYKDRVVAGGFYWSNALEYKPYEWEGLPKKASGLLDAVLGGIGDKIEFYVVDLAEKEDGDWIIMEFNDAQMSGLSDIDPVVFYNNLYEMLNG